MDRSHASGLDHAHRAVGEITFSSPPHPVGSPRWSFPPPSQWPGDDLIAIGGDLEPASLINAYRAGIFPMMLDLPETMVEVPRSVLAWWSPDPRGILPLDELRVAKSLRQSARRYQVSVDTCFGEVIRRCADPARERAWITDEFVDAYTRLHRLGWAHSVEVFDRQGQLVGGLYGIRINGFFAGESMFHLQRDASKVALVSLVSMMREHDMKLLDVQWQTDHLRSLGAVEVTRRQYLDLLADALATA
jgi:leucyl/phenylalanyl-tRNA--protein transferase